MFYVCLFYNVLSVSCWERTDLLALLCVMYICVFVTFLYGVLGQMMYLVISIPGLCLLLYFDQTLFGTPREKTCLWGSSQS